MEKGLKALNADRLRDVQKHGDNVLILVEKRLQFHVIEVSCNHIKRLRVLSLQQADEVV